jgi:hypothetical protein
VKAKELIEERGAEVALAASMAALTGHFRELKGRSLLSAYEGYTALILESERPIESDSKGWYLLRQMLSWEVTEHCRGCKRCMDEHKCIFDAPDHMVKKILQARHSELKQTLGRLQSGYPGCIEISRHAQRCN